MHKLAISSVCKIFENNTVGTKADKQVLNYIVEALGTHDTSKDRWPGQHLINLPPTVLPLVSAGVGLRTNNPDDYIVREWRGRCEMFLRREKAAQATGVTAIVYTLEEAYTNNLDVTPREIARLKREEITHVLVALLAFAGPESPPAPWTFIRNLAGANNEEKNAAADDIRERAKRVHDYYEKWCVVADAPPRFVIREDCGEDGVQFVAAKNWTNDISMALTFPSEEMAERLAEMIKIANDALGGGRGEPSGVAVVELP